MLKRLYVDNFRALSAFEWRPRDLELLWGPNGGGKSTVVEALAFVSGWIGGRVKAGAIRAEHRTRWDTRDAVTFELTLEKGGHRYDWRLVLHVVSVVDPIWSETFPKDETLTVDGIPVVAWTGSTASYLAPDGQETSWNLPNAIDTTCLRWGLSAWAADPRVRGFLAAVGTWWFLQPLACQRLVGLAGSTDKAGGLYPDGRNFPDWYLHASADQVRIPAFLDSMQEILPGFRAPVGPRQGTLDEMTFDFTPRGSKPGAVRYTWTELSDGQRSILMLYAVLHFGLADGGLLVVDEPESGIALDELEPWLRAVRDRVEDGDLQAMLVSHNPEFLDPLVREHGTRFERDPAGPVRISTEFPDGPLPPAEMIARGWADGSQG